MGQRVPGKRPRDYPVFYVTVAIQAFVKNYRGRFTQNLLSRESIQKHFVLSVFPERGVYNVGKIAKKGDRRRSERVVAQKGTN